MAYMIEYKNILNKKGSPAHGKHRTNMQWSGRPDHCNVSHKTIVGVSMRDSSSSGSSIMVTGVVVIVLLFHSRRTLIYTTSTNSIWRIYVHLYHIGRR